MRTLAVRADCEVGQLGSLSKFIEFAMDHDHETCPPLHDCTTSGWRILSLDGIHTDVFSLAAAAPDGGRAVQPVGQHLVILPGNPGVAQFYETVARAMHDEVPLGVDARHRCARGCFDFHAGCVFVCVCVAVCRSTQLGRRCHVHVLSHAGHELNGANPGRVFGLEQQVPIPVIWLGQ